MTDDPTSAPWPAPGFYFQVDLGGGVTGQFLQMEESDAPGRQAYVTLHRGIFANDAAFHDWYAAFTMKTLPRRAVMIRLQDEHGATKVWFTLNNAWPTHLISPDLTTGNQLPIEKLELAFESMTTAEP